MAAKKSSKKTAGKKSIKKSNFYIIRTFEEARTNLTDTAKEFNEKFIQKPIQDGKDFFEDFRKSPRKTIDNLIDDGKGFVTDTRNDTRTRIKTYIKDGKAFAKKAKNNPRKAVNGLLDDGREYIDTVTADTRKKIESYLEDSKDFMKGIENDTRKLVDDFVDAGKKAVDKIPGKKAIETNIDKRVKSIPRQLNLPSKEDVEKLNKSMKALSKKVETLRSQYAA